jgi:alkylation response protein AidB-like acyl-CoA dehydrogenase
VIEPTGRGGVNPVGRGTPPLVQPSSLLTDRPGPAAGGRPGARLTAMLHDGELALPDPGGGDTVRRWATLARWGRRDLPLARLAEGHVDAVAILRELGARPHSDARYGVWAARPGGVGGRLVADAGRLRLTGTVRFCSGSRDLDRALVVASHEGSTMLVDVALDRSRIRVDENSWAAQGMRASETFDVTFDDVAVADENLVGRPGGYLERPGFWWGGGGVAAVWLGGAAGVLDDVLDRPGGMDEHRLAHVGALHAELQAVDALLVRTAEAIDADPSHAHRTAVWTARAAAERACRTVLDRAPVAAGVTGMADSPTLGARLADLQIFVRQHHGERDLAALGAAVAEAR